MSRILNFGSVNLDIIYKVPHFVCAGETLSSGFRQLSFGGKGANQSVAQARAGAKVFHAGKMGRDGSELKKQLELDGIDCSFLIECDSEPTGHAIIQVSENDGNNAILLFGGANRKIDEIEMQRAVDNMSSGDILLMQNEINNPEKLIFAAVKRGLRIFWNPAPMTDDVKKCPLDKISLMALNEIECEQLIGIKVCISRHDTLQSARNALTKMMPNTDFIITLGADGSVFFPKDSVQKMITVPAFQTNTVDTTGAGDTFLGYFTAEIASGNDVYSAMRFASMASSISVSRMGAMSSIPYRQDVLNALNGYGRNS